MTVEGIRNRVTRTLGSGLDRFITSLFKEGVAGVGDSIGGVGGGAGIAAVVVGAVGRTGMNQGGSACGPSWFFRRGETVLGEVAAVVGGSGDPSADWPATVLAGPSSSTVLAARFWQHGSGCAVWRHRPGGTATSGEPAAVMAGRVPDCHSADTHSAASVQTASLDWRC